MTGAPAEPGGSPDEMRVTAWLSSAAIGLTLVSFAVNPLTLLSVGGIVLAWLALRRIRVVRATGRRVPLRPWLIATLVLAIVSTFFTGWNDLHLLGVL